MSEWEDYKADQARAWLERVRSLGAKAETVRAVIEDERAMMDGIRSPDPSSQRTGGASDDAMVNAVERLETHVRDYIVRLAEYEDERAEAVGCLDLMESDTERAVLTYRYLLGWEWRRICSVMSYSYGGIHKLTRRALVDCYEVMPVKEREPIYRAI